MYRVHGDADGGIYFEPIYRDSPIAPRRGGGRRQRPPRRPDRSSHSGHIAPRPPTHGGYVTPYPPPTYLMHDPRMYGMDRGMDMRDGMRALGALVPAVGQLVSAFRRAPERPELSGDPDKDMSRVVDYIASNFERERSNAQTAGVLATAGAVMDVLASM